MIIRDQLLIKNRSVFVLPFPLLYRLQLNRRQIWGLIATFSLGALTISMSIARFTTIEVIYAWTNVCKQMQYLWTGSFES